MMMIQKKTLKTQYALNLNMVTHKELHNVSYI